MTNMRTKESGGVHTPVHRVEGYDPQDDMLKVKSVQKKFRDSFGGSSIDATKWNTYIGSGCTLSVGGGVLTLGSGTTANQVVSVTTKETFSVPFRVSIGFTMSQRIANNTFVVEAISVDADGNPDGLHTAALLFDGTTATNGKYRVQNSGLAALDSAAVSLPTTASGSIYEIEPFADECWFHGGTLDSTSGRSNSYRRHQQIPDPNAQYKIRLRMMNGASAPASNTNAVVQFLAVQDYAELTAEITAGRGQSAAGQAIGVAVVSMPTTAVVPSPSVSNGYPSAGKLIAAAGTNATLVKNSATTVGWIAAFNFSGSIKFLKVYNKSSAPVVGTDVTVQVIPIPPGGETRFTPGIAGLRLSAGFSLAITGGMADSDTTAVAAGDVLVNWGYA